LRKKIQELENKLFSLQNWKGKDIKSIEREEDFWHIIEHQKSKESGKVHIIHHHIPHKNVLIVKKVLIEFHNKYINHKLYAKGCFNGHGKILAELKLNLVELYNLGFRNKQEFFGYRGRYFEYYYFPLKVLAHFGFIKYDSYGTVELKKKMFSEETL
jgi:hypothetical protein